MNLLNARTVKVAFVAVLTTAFALATAALATAGPFDPDYRGEPNSVHAVFNWVSISQAEWDTTLFETGPSGYELSAMGPFASDDGLNPTIILPNFIDPLEVKLMRIQMSFDGSVDGSLYGMQVLAHDDAADPVAVEVSRSTGLATTHYIDWLIRPNPDWEEIFMTGNLDANIRPGNLLTIEIDTISIPEPSSILLLCLGGLALLRLRRRGR